MACAELPLFPLRTVLFPGGELRLRIFEPRYLDLVRACCRQDRGFGICLLLAGQEAGSPATSAAFGTEARIVDFALQPDGLLGLTVRGGRRFHVARTRVRDNGVVMGDIDWLCEPDGDELRPEHGLLSVLLARMAERVGGSLARAEQRCYDDAAWVGWRLGELLPLTLPQRQALLQEPDPHARLDHLVQLLPEFQRA
ncbi:MAG: LON peptidase substrate-binding domain-containing protein [Rehaibacterium terrae]|jgi:Lon protease-like protein|uniref:LON peptidase substrate-binding domain-containing protein n=1 Tax=Rehaibacterium terrae TaxID=1341696 RepID=UPI00391D305A